jgi:hypothetical protein
VGDRWLKLGRTLVPRGTEVRVIARKDDTAHIVFLRDRWLSAPLDLTSVLGRNEI